MKLSVIIPCYKFEKYIEECINSILKQIVNFDYEILIRDDGSLDDTVKIINSKYSHIKNLRVLDSNDNVGVSLNPVLLYKETVGSYVFYLDGDDYLTDENYLQRAVDFLDSNKEYSVYSSGYRYCENDYIFPQNVWMRGVKKIVNLKDLLDQNYISFARVFRKINFSNYENFLQSPYPDWNFNFQFLKHGLGYCDENFCVGIYRLKQDSVFSKKTDEEKSKTNEMIKSRLKIEYDSFIKSQVKTITILDSYVHNQSIKNKLSNFVNWLIEDDHEICLISNTIIEKEILGRVKFYIYDSRNQLFDKKYTNLPYLDVYKTLNQNLEVHDISFSLQRHGLSVLINLFNVLKFAKEQGYTHFQRFEVDSFFGKKSREFVKEIPLMCKLNNKKGLFYYNHNNNPPDISFHYFYCEIDYFLRKIKNIKCEQDYIDYLKEFYGSIDFKIVETFIYDHLVKNKDNEIFEKNGTQMFIDFEDVIWNTESSISNFEKKYDGCVTRLYKNKIYNDETKEFVFDGNYTLLSYSYVNRVTERKIIVILENNDILEFTQKTICDGNWHFHNLSSNIKEIKVFENEKLLYSENKNECVSYIVYK